MTEEKKDIKNIIEVLDALEAAGVPVAKSLADGKIGLDDLAHLKSLIQEYEKFVLAVKDIKEVLPEAKDIDGLEAVAIVQKLFDVIKKIKAASEPAV